MQKISLFLLLFVTGFGYSQELVNFYVEPTTMSNVVTLHTSVYRSSVSFFGGYSVNAVNNEINVDLCYINNLIQSSIFDQQNFDINLPNGFNSYTINIHFYSDNDGASPCAQVNLIDTVSLIFAYPYNPVQKINIPDNVFEDYLEDRSFGDDIVNNDLVFTHRIENMTHLLLDDQFLPMSGEIQEITGIENFLALKDLRVRGNAITNLDLSSNLLLERLICYNNPLAQLDITNNQNLRLLWSDNTLLTSLDLTNNINLQDLTCDNNLLSAIDVSQNVNLLSLKCGSNQLDNLNLQNNILLETLSFSNNQISSIDLSNNTNLKNIRFNRNNFTTIDLSNSVLLESIDGIENQLTSVNLSNLTNLKDINFWENQLTTLDLSTNSMLEAVFLLSNNLTSLNLKNGNNENISLLATHGNPNLFCIDVDYPSQAPYPGWSINSQTTFSEDCSLNIIENETISGISIYPNPAKTKIFIEKFSNQQITAIKLYDVLGRVVLEETEGFNEINIASLNSGVLFLNIETEKGVLTKKLVKE